MALIPHSAHRIVDFATVLAFAAAPFVFGFDGAPAILSWVLAAVHLVLTLLTRYTPQGRGAMPFPVHGAIELLVGLSLAALPFLFGWKGDGVRVFYVGASIVILLVWLASTYDDPAAAETA